MDAVNVTILDFPVSYSREAIREHAALWSGFVRQRGKTNGTVASARSRCREG